MGPDIPLDPSDEATLPIAPRPTPKDPADPPMAELLNNDDIEELMASLAASEAPKATSPEGGVSEPPASATTSQDLISQDDLESLLDRISLSEAPELPTSEPSDVPPPVTQESIEVLMNQAREETFAADAATLAPHEIIQDDPLALPDGDDVAVSQDVIDALLRQAQDENVVAAEAPPAAMTPSEASPGVEPVEAAVVGVAMNAETPSQPRPDHDDTVDSPPRPSGEEVFGKPPRPLLRAGASIAAGLLTALCTWGYLKAHPYRIPDAPLAALEESGGRDAVSELRSRLEEGDYQTVLTEAEHALKQHGGEDPSGELRVLQVEARYRMLSGTSKIAPLDQLRRDIENLLDDIPTSDRAPDLMRWRADLYERTDMPDAAKSVYVQMIDSYPNAEGLDEVLYETARLSKELGAAEEARDWAQRLLDDYPASPRVGPAQLILGEATLALGDKEGAAEIFLRTAQTYTNSAVGADAYAHLGQLRYDDGLYDEAIQILETRLRTATKIEGNDRIYLLLAKAHRAQGNSDEAVRVLRELIDFFPDSKAMPQAMVELSQLLAQQGRSDEAVRVARQAASQFPEDAEVIKNSGRLLAGTGSIDTAAANLLKADELGAGDPDVLLEAGRLYRKSGQWDRALQAFERLEAQYVDTVQAHQAAIERAQTLYELGRSREAIGLLEKLAASTIAGSVRLQALDTLANLYDGLGMRARASDIYKDLAGKTNDSVVLARASVAMFRAGQWDDAQAVAVRVEERALPPELAYRFLMSHGAALLKATPDVGLRKMEDAYVRFPEFRTPEDEETLLRTYLSLDRTAAARAMVMDLQTRAKTDPAEGMRLLRAAVLWGDHLYGRGDYRAAEEAYALAIGAVTGDNPDTAWSKYQRANALLHLEDFAGGWKLFDEVARMPSDWQGLAKVKAEYAKAEMRRRGISASDPGTGASTERQG